MDLPLIPQANLPRAHRRRFLKHVAKAEKKSIAMLQQEMAEQEATWRRDLEGKIHATCGHPLGRHGENYSVCPGPALNWPPPGLRKPEEQAAG